MVFSTDSLNMEKINSCSSQELRVLFISHTYVVGVNQGKLAAIAATNEATVALMAPNFWQAKQWEKALFLESTYPEVQLYSSSVFFNGRGGAYFYNPWQLLRVIKSFNPDIIQVEEEVFSIATFETCVFARLLRKPMVVFGWENMDRKLSSPRRFMRKFVLDYARLIIAGNKEGGELLEQWGFKNLIEVMPQMGVDTEMFKPVSKTLDEAALKIGFVGRLAHAKGIDLLLKASQILNQEGLEFRLVICGSGPEEQTLKQLAIQLDVAHLIDWRGGVRHDEVPKEIANMDLLVLPSRTIDTWKEQFGHVLIEAMATGIPAVGSTCGEIPNVIGRSDLVFPQEDPQALAVILRRFITEPEWRQQMCHYSLERVHQSYSHTRIAQRLLTLWRKILSTTI